MAYELLIIPLLFLLQIPLLSLSVSAREIISVESVPDLQKLMYTVVDGYPCVRLLNLSGEIGCANPGRDKVVAPIVRFTNVVKLTEPSSLLVSADDIHDFFTRVSEDSYFARNTAGALIESGTSTQNKIRGFSPEHKFPQPEFAPYSDSSYEWNPLGSGFLRNAYQFPVYLLSESSSLTIQEHATENEKKKDYTASVAEFDLVMQTTKSGTRDSESCLEEGTCLPLGGYSVWSSLPPINVSYPDKSKPIILAMASMDSASFFRDKNLGAESPLSGLIALLAAVDALSNIDGLVNSTRQLVFLIFTGEAWGYLGSRRFLLELDLQSDAVTGLDATSIEMVVEVGSVGKVVGQEGSKKFYAHPTRASSATNETMNALKHAQDSLGSDKVTVSSASRTNPGIPPSSLMAFLKKNPQISGVVLEDFDTAFTNNFYHSHLDDSSNINSSAIATAASLVARTLLILASDEKSLSSSAVGSIKVNVSLVEQLMGCLLSCDPGLSCELVNKYITPTTTTSSSSCPSHYVGVILGEPSSTPYPPPGNVGDISRFLWNFLAERTSSSSSSVQREQEEGSLTSCSRNCSSKEQVCIRAETSDQKGGVCVVSTTRYVPAYSTRLKYESGSWNVKNNASNDDALLLELDPIWTESNWDAIGLRVYKVQAAAYDRLVLLGGIAITILAYLFILTITSLIAKALKQD